MPSKDLASETFNSFMTRVYSIVRKPSSKYIQGFKQGHIDIEARHRHRQFHNPNTQVGLIMGGPTCPSNTDLGGMNNVLPL